MFAAYVYGKSREQISWNYTLKDVGDRFSLPLNRDSTQVRALKIVWNSALSIALRD